MSAQEPIPPIIAKLAKDVTKELGQDVTVSLWGDIYLFSAGKDTASCGVTLEMVEDATGISVTASIIKAIGP